MNSFHCRNTKLNDGSERCKNRLAGLLLISALVILLSSCSANGQEQVVQPTIHADDQLIITDITDLASSTPVPLAVSTISTLTSPIRYPSFSLVPTEASNLCNNESTDINDESSAPPIKITYIKNNDIWMWDQQSGKTWALTDSQDVSEMKLSPDHQSIAFIRGPNNNPLTLMAFEPVPSYHLKNLWVIDINDSSSERLIVSQDDLLEYRQDDTHEVINFSQFEWMPDSQQIIFSTQGIVPLIHDYYIYPNDDLHVIDVTNRHVRTVLKAGEGGVFKVSPNGKHAALGTKTGVSLIDLDKNIRYDYPIEFEIEEWNVGAYVFRPSPNWTEDSSFFITVTENGGKWPSGNMTVWHIPVLSNDLISKAKARSLGNYSGFILNTLLSPDLKYLAVTQLGEGFEIHALESNEVLLSITGTGSEEQVIFQSWHPDSRHFTYRLIRPDEDAENIIGSQIIYSDLCGFSKLINEPFTWVSSSKYIFALELPGDYLPGSVYRNWELRLNSVDGESVLIEQIDNEPLHWEPFVTVLNEYSVP